MPTACTLSTAVWPGAATAAGRGLSSARAAPVRSGRSRKGVAFAINRMVRPRFVLTVIASEAKQSSPESFRWDSLDCFVASLLAMTMSSDVTALRRHRLVEVLRDLVEEAGGRQPALIGADQEGEVLGHVAVLDGRDADLLEGRCELRQRLVVVELGAVAEAARPGEDRGDRIGRGLLALLVLAEVAGNRTV